MSRLVAYACYSTIAQRLPRSTGFFGRPAAWIRRRLAHYMLRACGEDINVEHGARFGSGRLVSIGDRSGIGVDCHIYGEVDIGNDVMMGPEVIILTTGHASGDISRPMLIQGHLPERSVVIEDDVWIGTRAILLPGITVGRGSIVGAGAVVSRSVPPGSVVVGNPARVVRNRLDDVETQSH